MLSWNDGMSSAKILIRCNAGSRVGFGHLRRCQSLAYALRSSGAEIDWVVETDVPWVLERVKGSGRLLEGAAYPFDQFEEMAQHLQSLAEGYDALVLDHYALAEYADDNFYVPWLRFDQGARTKTTSARWIHNALPGVCASEYEGILSNVSAQLLLGPQFSILDPGFAASRAGRANDPIHYDAIRHLLFTFGGGDDKGLNLMALDVVEAVLPEVKITILCTSANGSLPFLRERAACDGLLTLLVDSQIVHEVMKRADLAICAAGTTLCELACLGVPAFATILAPNQERPARLWEKTGCVEIISRDVISFQEGLTKKLANLLAQPGRLRNMASVGPRLIDGLGAERTAQEILAHI